MWLGGFLKRLRLEGVAKRVCDLGGLELVGDFRVVKGSGVEGRRENSMYGYVNFVWVLYFASVEGIREVRADRRVRTGAPNERVRMSLSMLWEW